MQIDLDLLDYALLALRCLLVYNIEEQVGPLYMIYFMRILNNITELLNRIPNGRLLSIISPVDVADLYRRRGLVEDVLITRKGRYLTVEIVGCRVAREVHPLIKRREHVCPLLMPLMLALCTSYGPCIKLVDYPSITFDGALVKLELTSLP